MHNSARNLLKPTNLMSMQKRQKMSGNVVETFEPTISTQNPLADYTKLMEEKVQTEDIVSDEVMNGNYKKIAAAARETVWKLLFAEKPATKENQAKAAELLDRVKADACFYSPWDYNRWIAGVRDEVLKREMLDFWKEEMVKRELGPCWARDSDYFDDSTDRTAEEFYKHAGCVAPFTAEAESQSDVGAEGTENQPDEQAGADDIGAPFEATISVQTPVEDYEKLIKDKVVVEQIVDDEILQRNYKKIAKAARDTVWKLLFAEKSATKEQQDKAANLLEKAKADAGFYSPWDYNRWIVKVRDEVLKRKMLDFWKDQMVKRELGPCWARDSDYFDDPEDPSAEEFYKHAGCVAPFSKGAKADN